MAEPNKNFLSFVFGSKNGNTNKTGKQPQSGGKVPKTSQSTIPYRAAYDNGIIEIEQGIFSKSYFIDDVNFKIASQTIRMTYSLNTAICLICSITTKRLKLRCLIVRLLGRSLSKRCSWRTNMTD